MSLDNAIFGHMSHERDHIDVIITQYQMFYHVSHQKDHIDVITQYKVWPPVTQKGPY